MDKEEGINTEHLEWALKFLRDYEKKHKITPRKFLRDILDVGENR